MAVLAGILGGLLGLGGGVILVPALSSVLGVPLAEAVGTSLIAVASTSVSSTVAYVKQGLTEVELGIGLVVLTSIGAVLGGTVGMAVGAPLIAALFALLAIYTAVTLVRREWRPAKAPQTGADAQPASGTAWYAYPLIAVAGMLSGLLGIGGGPVNVPVLRFLVHVPFKRATATSSFMVGVTAATGGLIYFLAGRVELLTAGACATGVIIGAQIAARLHRRLSTRWLALLFAVVLVFVGVQMVVVHR